MSGLKGGGLLLLLGLPVVGYFALQVKDVFRTDIIASDSPADRGMSREQLTAAHAKSTAAVSEVRKAAAITCQFRAAGPEDASPDPATAALVKASASRAADLNDLDLFLSEVERPNFTGKLKDQYAKWVAERKELKRDEEAVLAWLSRPQTIMSPADATKAMDAVNALIVQYTTRSKFSDNAKATVWRVRSRLILTDALAVLADTQYREAVKVKLPLKDGNNEVKTAVETLRALKAMIHLLNTDAARAEEEKKLEATLRAQVDATNAITEDCKAREELLVLFAKEDLFTNSGGASAWLGQVGAQYRKTKDEKTRRLIREKVQEFCDAFIPDMARLDDKVLLKGKEVDRKDVVIKYQMSVGGMVVREPLSGALDGANEFNLKDKRPGDSTFVVHKGAEEYPKDLQPTNLSRAAILFNGLRKQLADNTAVPRWTAKSVDELKKKCEAQKELVDQLQTLNKSVGTDPKIWTRLTELATGMAGNADLFVGQ
jgi:hypothetical protein